MILTTLLIALAIFVYLFVSNKNQIVAVIAWWRSGQTTSPAAPAVAQGFLALPAIGWIASLFGNVSGLSGLLSGLAGGLWSVVAALITALPAMLNSPLGAAVIFSLLFGTIGYEKGLSIGASERKGIRDEIVREANVEADKAIKGIRMQAAIDLAAVKKACPAASAPKAKK